MFFCFSCCKDTFRHIIEASVIECFAYIFVCISVLRSKTFIHELMFVHGVCDLDSFNTNSVQKTEEAIDLDSFFLMQMFIFSYTIC